MTTKKQLFELLVNVPDFAFVEFRVNGSHVPLDVLCVKHNPPYFPTIVLCDVDSPLFDD